jgi:hypothetical protein
VTWNEYGRPNCKYYPGIYMEGLSETTKTSEKLALTAIFDTQTFIIRRRCTLYLPERTFRWKLFLLTP